MTFLFFHFSNFIINSVDNIGCVEKVNQGKWKQFEALILASATSRTRNLSGFLSFFFSIIFEKF